MMSKSYYCKGWVLFIALLLVLTGCCATKSLTITSVPGDARISVDGADLGNSPVVKEFCFKEQPVIPVLVEKKGFRSATIDLAYEPKEKIEYTVTLEPLTKKVSITSNPPGVQICIDGAVKGSTPYSEVFSFVEKDSYTLVVTKKGYRSSTLDVAFNPESKVEYKVSLEPITKSVNVTSEPSGVQVSIDGVVEGTTPFSKVFSFVDRDSYKLEAVKHGYRDATLEIANDPESVLDYNLVLYPITKNVTVTSNPAGAQISIDGAKKGLS
ncbi:MAG: PEGA domain-containing protein [Pseudomonadota bacterium]|nr:PEGA domain-containing protein [Pseudomonadota bacterium]